MTDSSREAQAEIRNTTAKSETAYAAKRGIIGTEPNQRQASCNPQCPVSANGRASRRSRSHRRTRLALSFANGFLENRSKTIWVPQQSNPRRRARRTADTK